MKLEIDKDGYCSQDVYSRELWSSAPSEQRVLSFDVVDILEFWIVLGSVHLCSCDCCIHSQGHEWYVINSDKCLVNGRRTSERTFIV